MKPLVLMQFTFRLLVFGTLIRQATIAAANSQTTEEQKGTEPTNPPLPTAPTFLDSTTITARAHETEVFGVSTPVSVIPKKQLERQLPESALDLLTSVAGTDVVGVGRNQTRPIIRGQRGLRVLLLEDGIRINHPRRQADFGEIGGVVDPGDVSRIEVVRGPLSVLYGSDAAAGVVHLITHQDQPGPLPHGLAGSLDTRYRSQGELVRLGFGLTAGGRRWRTSVSGSMREADDYRSGTGRFGALTASEPLLVEDTGVRDQSASASFQFDLSSTWTLEGRLRSYQAEDAGFGFVDPVRLGSTDPTKVRIRIPDQRYDRWSLRLDGAPRKALADALELVAAWQQNDRLLTNLVDLNLGPTIPGAPPSTLSVSSRNTTDLGAQTVRLELGKQLGAKSLWSYGLEWLRETARGTDRSTAVTRLRFPFPPFERVIVQERDLPNLPTAMANHAAIFFQEEHRWGERWKTTAGLRYQRAQMEARPTRGWEVEGLDFEDQELVGTLSVVRQIGTRWQAFASYGTGFRAPNMVELLFQGPTPEGAGFQVRNPNLRSERSTSWDLGLRYRSAPLSLEAVAFRSELRDGIVQAFLSSQEIANLPTGVQQEIQQSGARLVVEQRNLDRLRVEGVELATELRSSRGFLGGLSFTYLDDQRLSVSAEPLEGVYRERWTWHLSYQPTSASWWLEYRGRYQRGNALPIDPSIPQPVVGFRVPNFDVHSLGFGVRFETRSRLSHQITLRLENLANALYAEAANTAFFRPEPGREWLVAYQLRF